MRRSAGLRLLLASVAAAMTSPISVEAGTSQAPNVRPTSTSRSDTVHVEPPGGEPGADRARILASLERARPGGTVLFAPGTYHVGEVIPLETPHVTLLGHPDGTTLRGCDPATYEELEREAVGAFASADRATSWALVRRCGMLELTGGHVTVRDLTFELGDGVRARSVNGSGQSTNPASPHYTDQAELYGRGEFKPVWTSLQEVRANAVRVYRPGAEER